MDASTVETGREGRSGVRDQDEWRVWPCDAAAWLRQGYREGEARIGFGHGPNVEFYFTLSEAAELRDLLTSLIDQAVSEPSARLDVRRSPPATSASRASR